MATGDDSLIWTRPEPGTRKPKLTRERIASTALAIADDEGFAAVSMRRVAADLGVGTMTLYYYVRTKDELVALMDDAMMGEVLLPALPPHWRDALTAIAVRTWEVLMRRPWALFALQNAARGPNSMRHFEQSLAAVADTGLDAPAKFALLALVDDYVRGNVVGAAELAGAADDEAVEAAIAYGQAQLATGEYPHTRALFGDQDPRQAFPQLLGGQSARERFEAGLSVLLAGAASELDLPLP